MQQQENDLELIATALEVYGLIIFPKALGYIDSRVIDLFHQVMHGVNPVPAILAETFRSLNYCRTKGLESSVVPHYYTSGWRDILSAQRIGSQSLTRTKVKSQLWNSVQVNGQDHFPKIEIFRSRNSQNVEWRAPWVKPCPVAYRYGSYPWLPLLGPWGGVSYAPAMVRRQFGEKQFVPTTHELSELEFSYKDKGAIALVKEIAEAWKQVHRGTPGILTDATSEGYRLWEGLAAIDIFNRVSVGLLNQERGASVCLLKKLAGEELWLSYKRVTEFLEIQPLETS